MSHAQSTTRIAIVLVHGTWGRGFFPNRRRRVIRPRWFESRSSFRTSLSRAFGQEGLPEPDVIEHLWSGRNSIIERDLAAHMLAARIDALRARDADTIVVVIGHSHGGNVMLRALAHGNIDRRPPLLISLATPFMELAANEVSHHTEFGMVEPGVAIIAITVCAALGVFVPGVPIVLTLGVVAVILAIYFFREARSAGRRTRVRRRIDALVAAASHDGLRRSRAPLLVLRGVDDEAALMLAAGAITTRLAQIMNRLLLAPFMGFAVLFCIVLVTSIVEGKDGTLVSGDLLLTLLVGFFAFLGAFFIADLLVRATPAVYGRELLLMPADIEVNSHSAPDAEGLIAVRTLARATTLDTRMRHGLYDEPDCVPAIVRWLKQQALGTDVD